MLFPTFSAMSEDIVFFFFFGCISDRKRDRSLLTACTHTSYKTESLTYIRRGYIANGTELNKTKFQ